MKLMFAVWVWGAMACSTDERPERTLAYVTETILAPSCANAECHSAFKREKGYAFDTVELAQDSLFGGPVGTRLLIGACATPGTCSTDPTEGDPLSGSSYLLTVIYQQDDEGDRMPYDSALPDADKQLISDWIRDGASGFDPTNGQ